MKQYFTSLKLRDEIKDKKGIADSYNNIGNLFYIQTNYKEALKNYYTSLQIRIQLKDTLGIAASFNNIGVIFDSQKNLKGALNSFLSALKMRIEIDDKSGMATSYNNIGTVYQDQGDNEKALVNFEKSLELLRITEDKQGIAVALINMANVYTKQKRIAEARKFLNEAKQIATDLQLMDELKYSYNSLSTLDSLQQNFKGAYFNFYNYILYRDSIVNEENTQKIFHQQMQYEFDKKESIIKLEQEKKDVIASEEKQKQSIILYAVIVRLALVLLFSIFMYKRYKTSQSQKALIEKQKLLVDEKHKEITDSIHYAKHIQQALLTSEKYISKNLISSKTGNALAEYFIFYQSKDIVSGDFYWANRQDEIFYIATADCTGHGVPGAFMSLLNISFLNENVIEKGIKEPAEILNEQRRQIIHALNPSGNENSKDGMDCVLCAFDFENKNVRFALANNPLWIIRDNKFIEFKADKMPVSKYEREHTTFTPHSVELKCNDIFYTFTDGVTDQFGGEERKKLLHKRFQQILLDINDLPMHEQKVALENRFNEWKGAMKQIDDVLVVAIKIV